MLHTWREDRRYPSFSITLRQSEDAGRQIKVRRFGHSQVDDKFERGRPLNRYFGNRRAAQILIICRANLRPTGADNARTLCC